MSHEVQHYDGSGAVHNELFVRYKNGDDQAFDELYEQLSLKLHRRLLRLDLTYDEAADGVQFVFEKLAAKAGELEVSNISAWTMVVAHNYAMDLHRKRVRQNKIFIPAYSDETEPIPSLNSEFKALEAQWTIHDIIDQVRQHDGAGFDEKSLGQILRMLSSGETFSAVADTIGVAESTVKTRVHRLKVRLANSAFTLESLDR